MVRRLTTAQAIVKFLKVQHSAHDGREQQLFGRCFGIFVHGNVAGIGQALQENPAFPTPCPATSKPLVHTAAAFAKVSNQLPTLVCTTSIGP
jgi:3D-(3,5/4)-trihydroxycyclohexane-1,2-dione acylhydrolase (decyclizing)